VEHASSLVWRARRFLRRRVERGAHPFWAGKLRRFDAISVRDRNSREMLRQALDLDPDLVLDPVLQFPEEMPDPAQFQSANTEPYIAVYGHSFPAWYAEAVRDSARDRGLRLVSIGYRNDWADEQRLDCGPDEFARGIGSASAVVTNFFHGLQLSGQQTARSHGCGRRLASPDRQPRRCFTRR
jgi:hypothetical protein